MGCSGSKNAQDKKDKTVKPDSATLLTNGADAKNQNVIIQDVPEVTKSGDSPPADQNTTAGDASETWIAYYDSSEGRALRQIVKTMETEDGRSQLRSLFESLDVDANGKVNSKEWGHAVSKNKDLLSKYFGGSSLKELGQVFKRIDIDGSNDLTWEEFQQAAADIGATLKLADAMLTPEGRAELKSLFDQLDKDSNGKVSSKEWGSVVAKNKDMMAKYFGGSSMAEVGKAFKMIDADKSNDLTWEEFEVAASKFCPSSPTAPTERFAMAEPLFPLVASKSQADVPARGCFFGMFQCCTVPMIDADSTI